MRLLDSHFISSSASLFLTALLLTQEVTARPSPSKGHKLNPRGGSKTVLGKRYDSTYSSSFSFSSGTSGVPSNNGSGLTEWYQCGGKEYHGSTTCASGCYCKIYDSYFSQCTPTRGWLCSQANSGYNGTGGYNETGIGSGSSGNAGLGRSGNLPDDSSGTTDTVGSDTTGSDTTGSDTAGNNGNGNNGNGNNGNGNNGNGNNYNNNNNNNNYNNNGYNSTSCYSSSSAYSSGGFNSSYNSINCSSGTMVNGTSTATSTSTYSTSTATSAASNDLTSQLFSSSSGIKSAAKTEIQKPKSFVSTGSRFPLVGAGGNGWGKLKRKFRKV